MTASSELAIVSDMHHPLRSRPTRDRIIDMEVMRLELRKAQPRVAMARPAKPVPVTRALARKLRRAA